MPSPTLPNVIVVHLDAPSVAKIRFAVSPAFEAMNWLQRVAMSLRHPILGDPGPAARFALRDPDVALLAMVLSDGGRYVPDHLTPKPVVGSAIQAWHTQLEMMRAADSETVAAELAGCRDVGDEVRDAAESGTFARRAARGMSVFWQHAIADWWPEIHGRLEADLSARARTMATNGIGVVLGTLSPKIGWSGTALTVHKSSNEDLHYVDTELVLAPVALAWPELWTQLSDPEDATLTYPAYGVGASASATAPVELGRLVGSTRATLLRDLDMPRSTTDLSTRHQLAPATVSYHLRVLYGSGLVNRVRDGRAVLYGRTEQGDALYGRGVRTRTGS